MSTAAFQKLQPEEYLKQHYNEGLRPDGRKGLHSLRPVSISVGSITSADGSAVVKQGDTIVVCGIKLEIASPKTENPNEGFIVPNLALSPICHSQFRPGPPSDLAQTASHFLHESIINSGILSTKDLCILEGKYVWTIYADLTCLNFAGNILDTSLKALIAALKSVKLPQTQLIAKSEEEEKVLKINIEAPKTALKIGSVPTSISIAVFDDNLLLDPTDEEEDHANAVVTVVLTQTNELCHVHKPGGIGISPEKLQQCISLAKKNAKTVQKLIDSAASSALK